MIVLSFRHGKRRFFMGLAIEIVLWETEDVNAYPKIPPIVGWVLDFLAMHLACKWGVGLKRRPKTSKLESK